MLMASIYHEHIEEAAFLYDQRNILLSEPDGDLAYQAEIEERLEAHIDGLIISAEQSKPILLEYLGSDDEGECFAAIYSIMRMGENEEKEMLDILEENPGEFPNALIAAFKFHNSANLIEYLVKWLDTDSIDLKKIALTVLGCKRYKKGLLLFEQGLHSEEDIGVKAVALRAITRIDASLGRSFAYTTLINGSDKIAILEACFENLYTQQETNIFEIARQYCEQDKTPPDIAPIILGLRADPSDMQLLLEMISSGKTDRSVFQAIGFTGMVNLLEKLIPLEDNEELLPFIQESAHMILGCEAPEFVDLSEDEMEELEIDEDEEEDRFSLKNTLASINLAEIEKTRYRLGKGEKIPLEIGGLYRKWLYLEFSHKKGKFITIDYDNPAIKGHEEMYDGSVLQY